MGIAASHAVLMAQLTLQPCPEQTFSRPVRAGYRFLWGLRGNTIQTIMDLLKATRRGREAALLQLFDEHHLPLFRCGHQAGLDGLAQPHTGQPLAARPLHERRQVFTDQLIHTGSSIDR